MSVIKLLSLFSGIGAFEKALDNLGGYELVNYCEIDKFASKAYSLIHNEPITKNLVDVTKIDCTKLPKDIDLITYGFPCQDISLVGKQKGFSDNGVQTRSGLVFDALRIIENVKPKYAVCENVKNLTGKKFKQEFETILGVLNDIGYNNYWKVLNAADYGVPQKRERVFIISIRKDIDKGSFEFPKPFVLTKRLKDVLEDDVASKYFLSERLASFFYENMKKQKSKGNGFVFAPIKEEQTKDTIAKTITTRAGSRMDDNYIKTIGYYQPSCREASRVLDPNGIAPTVKENHDTVNVIKLTELTSGVAQAQRVYDVNGLAVTLKGEAGGLGAKTGLYKIKSDIRKLTPKECFRLMGFDDKDIDVLKANGISDTQLYKMAGNSIVVDVLYYIFKNLFKNV